MKKNIAIALMIGFTAMGAQAADRSLSMTADTRPVVSESQAGQTADAKTESVEIQRDLYFDAIEVDAQEVDANADGDIQNI